MASPWLIMNAVTDRIRTGGLGPCLWIARPSGDWRSHRGEEWGDNSGTEVSEGGRRGVGTERGEEGERGEKRSEGFRGSDSSLPPTRHVSVMRRKELIEEHGVIGIM